MSFEVTDVYTDKYVVFLDLLGFKSKVNDADTNPEVTERDTQCLRYFTRHTLQ